jgi:hypothetical protein
MIHLLLSPELDPTQTNSSAELSQLTTESESESESVSESYVTTNAHSASLSWNKAPIWGLRSDFCYCQTVAGLFMWGALPDEWTGLSFTIVASPRQRSHIYCGQTQ